MDTDLAAVARPSTPWLRMTVSMPNARVNERSRDGSTSVQTCSDVAKSPVIVTSSAPGLPLGGEQPHDHGSEDGDEERRSLGVGSGHLTACPRFPHGVLEAANIIRSAVGRRPAVATLDLAAGIWPGPWHEGQ